MRQLLSLICSFFISLLLVPLIRKVSAGSDAFARQNKRTIHHGKISRIGGIAIYAAFAISMSLFIEPDRALIGAFLASSMMFFTGLADDFFDLKPGMKMLFQFLAACLLIQYGVRTDSLHLPFGIVIDWPILSALFTLVWVVGITNAVNLMDGLDGLAGGISLVVFSIVASISLVDHRMDMITLSMVMCGALLGFLIYNAHPASIFMGDCGSLFLGCMIASTSLMGFKSSTILTLALPILILLLPIIDSLSAILRRKIKGQSFSTADKKHLHHQLMRRFGHGNTVVIMCGITFLFGLCAFLYIYDRKFGLLLILILLVIIEVFIEKTGMISPYYRPLLGFLNRIIGGSERPNQKRSANRQTNQKHSSKTTMDESMEFTIRMSVSNPGRSKLASQEIEQTRRIKFGNREHHRSNHR